MLLTPAQAARYLRVALRDIDATVLREHDALRIRWVDGPAWEDGRERILAEAAARGISPSVARDYWPATWAAELIQATELGEISPEPGPHQFIWRRLEARDFGAYGVEDRYATLARALVSIAGVPPRKKLGWHRARNDVRIVEAFRESGVEGLVLLTT